MKGKEKMKCMNPQCGKELDPRFKVCPYCETEVPEAPKCPGCGKEVNPVWSACAYCGMDLKQAGSAGSGAGVSPGGMRLDCVDGSVLAAGDRFFKCAECGGYCREENRVVHPDKLRLPLCSKCGAPLVELLIQKREEELLEKQKREREEKEKAEQATARQAWDRFEKSVLQTLKAGDVSTALQEVRAFLGKRHGSHLEKTISEKIPSLEQACRDAVVKDGLEKELHVLGNLLRRGKGLDEVAALYGSYLDTFPKGKHAAEIRRFKQLVGEVSDARESLLKSLLKAGFSTATQQARRLFENKAYWNRFEKGQKLQSDISKKIDRHIKETKNGYDKALRQAEESLAGKRLKKALSHFSAAQKVCPDSGEVKRKIKAVKDRIDSANELIGQGKTAIAEAEFSKAEECLAQAVDLFADVEGHASAFSLLGKTREEYSRLVDEAEEKKSNRQLSEAESLFEKAQRLCPSATFVRIRLGEVSKDIREARDAVGKIGEEIDSADFDAARRLVEKAKRIYPAVFGLENAEKKLEETESRYTQHLKDAQRLSNSKKFEEALKELKKALALCPLAYSTIGDLELGIRSAESDYKIKRKKVKEKAGKAGKWTAVAVGTGVGLVLIAAICVFVWKWITLTVWPWLCTPHWSVAWTIAGISFFCASVHAVRKSSLYFQTDGFGQLFAYHITLAAVVGGIPFMVLDIWLGVKAGKELMDFIGHSPEPIAVGVGTLLAFGWTGLAILAALFSD